MTDLTNFVDFILTWIDLPFWEIVIKSTLIVAMVAFACQLLGGQSAALRHRLWVIGLAAALLVPAVSLLLPQLMLPVLPRKAAAIATKQDMQPLPLSIGTNLRPNSSHGLLENVSLPRTDAEQFLPGSSTNAENPNAQGQMFKRVVTALPRVEQLLGLTWLLGTALSWSLFAMLVAVQRMRLARLSKIEDADWIAAVTSAANAIGLRQSIVTLQSGEACVPAVAGVLAPRLLIPANWRTWSQSQRHCVLLHELAHVKRRDIAAQMLGRLALFAYWFNPMFWYALRQLRVERELASDDCVLRAGQAASDYAEQLLRTLRTYRPARLELGIAMAHSARLDQRVLAILDPHRPRDTAGLRLSCFLSCISAALVCSLGTLTLTSHADEEPAPRPDKMARPVWHENYAVEYSGTLPVSVAFSSDGKFLLTGDTSGEVMALILAHESPTYRWKTKVGGSHAAVAYSADQNKVYATTKDGVSILDAATGKEEERIEVADSSAIALGIFPDKEVAEGVTRHQIAVGDARGYFVESWVDGKLAETRGTIKTSTTSKDAKPADAAAVPLAVDPNGRSAIMTGPIDATGASGGVKGKNVLWAYVCGDYDDGSPGNRILIGHKATVVSAAWSRDGSAAVTGDADGRVLVWDTATMKEVRRLELGGRIAALAISPDGERTAAYVLGKQGEVYVWDTAKLLEKTQLIHTELSDFADPHSSASLAFSPDGTRLAGSAIHKKWLTRLGDLTGKVRVWELAAEPKAQLGPMHSYVKELPGERSANFVLLNNESLLMPASKEGAVDLRGIADGVIQARIVLGKFTIGGLKMSSDRKWLAIEQHTPVDKSAIGSPDSTFDVGIYAAPILFKATIPACSQLLDVTGGGNVVAVIREKRIELWDAATAKKLKAAPFKHTQINAACFSPDGQVLAISDHNELVLWRWERDTHERTELSGSVKSLAFSPDGKLLAEGPSPGGNIQLRSLETRKVVQALSNGEKRTMSISQLAFTQGGRVLIACDDISDTETPVSHRIYLWDTADGSMAQQIEIPSGLPKNIEVSPNGRHLVAALEESQGIKLSAWRLDGREPEKGAGAAPPAATPTATPR